MDGLVTDRAFGEIRPWFTVCFVVRQLAPELICGLYLLGIYAKDDIFL